MVSKCPHRRWKYIDSRATPRGQVKFGNQRYAIDGVLRRRRRECLVCRERSTTYEIEENELGRLHAMKANRQRVMTKIKQLEVLIRVVKDLEEEGNDYAGV